MAERRRGATSMDGEAWAELLREHAPRLAAIALLHADSDAEAEELLQAALCDVVGRAREVEDPLAYLAGAIRNAAATRARRAGARRRAVDARREIDVAALAGRDAAPDAAPLLAALHELSEAQREVVLLRTRAGLGFAQIGAVLEVPESTAASHYRRGIEKLRHLLSEEPTNAGP